MSESKCALAIPCWDGATYNFDLSHRWVMSVITYCGIPGAGGSSVAACLQRFETGNYSPEDVERVIELGLIGGGMGERDVEALLDAHVRGKPLAPNVILANKILSALFVGKPVEAA